jgi:hypothetical protein
VQGGVLSHVLVMGILKDATTPVSRALIFQKFRLAQYTFKLKYCFFVSDYLE